MMLQIQQQSLLVGRKPSGFSEHYYTEWDDGLGKERISLFLVITIESTQVPGDDIGKEAFQLLQDHFLNDLEGDPYDRFENALREVNLMFKEQEKELGVKFIPNVNVICGVIQKDMLFLSKRGDAHAYLIRKRHVSSISDGLVDEKNTEDVFQNIASGVLEVNDSVILATGKLVHFVTPGDLAKIFSEQSLDEGSAELKDLLDADIEDQMAILSFEVLEKTSEEVVVEEPKEEKAAEAKIEEPESIKASERLVKPIKVLREWAVHKDRLQFFERFRNWRREKVLAAIIIIGVLLAAGLTWAFVSGGKQKQIESMESKLSVAEENIVQAETRGAFDKQKAAELLDESEGLAIEVLNSGFLRGKASQLLDQIEEQRDFLDNIVRVDDEIKEVVDFTPILGNDEIIGVVSYRDRRVVLTRTQAYQILIDDVQEPDVIENTESVIAGTYFQDPQNIVMLTSSGKVLEYEEGNSQFADTADVDWESGIDVDSYSSRIYILDPEDAQIWKYRRGNAGYGSKQAYLGDEVEDVDLSEALSITIDGSIWILMDDGTIVQLLSGVREPFVINKAPLTSQDKATKIYTELELTQLFVLDPSENRILMYNKSTRTSDLTYSSQFVLENVKGNLVDMFVDKDKDVYVIVTDKALYELSF